MTAQTGILKSSHQPSISMSKCRISANPS